MEKKDSINVVVTDQRSPIDLLSCFQRFRDRLNELGIKITQEENLAVAGTIFLFRVACRDEIDRTVIKSSARYCMGRSYDLRLSD